MHQIIYTSAATHLISEQELRDLLVKARENNERLGITGMLLYKGGDFMQVIEGEQAVLRKLFDRIARDPRHSMVTVLKNAPISERAFADWLMGFRSVSAEDVNALPGYTDFLTRRLIEAKPADVKRAHRMLTTFSRT